MARSFFSSLSVNSLKEQDLCHFATGKVLTLTSSSLLHRTIVPKCLIRRCSFRVFCCNLYSSFALLFFDSACVCVNVFVTMTMCLCGMNLFLRSYDIQWNLYDNCTAGNINYTFSLFTVSSHHLLGSTCKVRQNELGLCCTTLYSRDVYSPQLPLS